LPFVIRECRASVFLAAPLPVTFSVFVALAHSHPHDAALSHRFSISETSRDQVASQPRDATALSTIMPPGAGVSALANICTYICLYLQVNRYRVPRGPVPDYGRDAYTRTPIRSKWRTSHQTSLPSPVVTTVCYAEDTRDGMLKLPLLSLILPNAS
jgi:hypothetical protein